MDKENWITFNNSNKGIDFFYGLNETFNFDIGDKVLIYSDICQISDIFFKGLWLSQAKIYNTPLSIPISQLRNIINDKKITYLIINNYLLKFLQLIVNELKYLEVIIVIGELNVYYELDRKKIITIKDLLVTGRKKREKEQSIISRKKLFDDQTLAKSISDNIGLVNEHNDFTYKQLNKSFNDLDRYIYLSSANRGFLVFYPHWDINIFAIQQLAYRYNLSFITKKYLSDYSIFTKNYFDYIFVTDSAYLRYMFIKKILPKTLFKPFKQIIFIGNNLSEDEIRWLVKNISGTIMKLDTNNGLCEKLISIH